MNSNNFRWYADNETGCAFATNKEIADVANEMLDDLVTNIDIWWRLYRPEAFIDILEDESTPSELDGDLDSDFGVISNISGFIRDEKRKKNELKDSFGNYGFLRMEYVHENPIILNVKGTLHMFPTAQHAWLAYHSMHPSLFEIDVAEYSAERTFARLGKREMSTEAEARLLKQIIFSKFLANKNIAESLMKLDIESFLFRNGSDRTLGVVLEERKDRYGNVLYREYVGRNFLGIALKKTVQMLKPLWDGEHLNELRMEELYSELLGI